MTYMPSAGADKVPYGDDNGTAPSAKRCRKAIHGLPKSTTYTVVDFGGISIYRPKASFCTPSLMRGGNFWSRER